ncbi:expressed unknown protein [Seminavis robusta]|uniref:Nuclear segregation protein n=1 Tax=Seminavis robusta TaxID=568900 RepID=A0A9N8ESP8_9STRA|nr:expressed unknown protein [Seminavis robusta]|eukprot:Sro1765_g296180.1 n/a (580) ;mRNA; f:11592-13500
MAEETKAEEAAAPAAAAEETKKEETAAADGTGGNNNKGKNNKNNKKDETPIEELYDLSKPIPRVPKPSKEDHEKELAELTAALDKLKEDRQKVQKEIDAALDKNKTTGLGKEKEELQKLRSAKNALIEEKKAIRSKLDQFKSQADRIAKDRKDARSSVKFTSVADIDKELSKLQRRQETTSMSLPEEKKLLKEMDALRKSKEIVASLQSAEGDMDNVKEQRKTIQALLQQKDKEIDAIQQKVEAQQQVIKSMSDKDGEKRTTLQSHFAKRDEFRNAFNEKLKEKDALRADFREKNNVWYNYQRAVRAQKKIQYEEDKKKRDEEHQAYLKKVEEEELKKVPYEAEQALCDYLADYLTTTYLQDKNAAKQEDKKEDVVAVKDDPFAGFKPVSKKNAEEDEYFGKGKGKKKRDRGNKNQDKKGSGPFTLSVDTFEQFGLIGLNPPTTLEMVEPTVTKLREKKEWYSKQPRGSVPTAMEIRKANERAAEKIRQQGKGADSNNNSNSNKKGNNNNNKKGFDLADDFAPLPGANTGSNAPMSMWGKPAINNTTSATNRSAPTPGGPDPTPQEAAAAAAAAQQQQS